MVWSFDQTECLSRGVSGPVGVLTVTVVVFVVLGLI